MCVDQLTLLFSSCDEKEVDDCACGFFTHGVSGRYPSGQRGQTVNLLAYVFQGSNPCLPTSVSLLG